MNYDLPDLWLRLYNVNVVVLLPIIVNTIFNVGILWPVRSSARRVHTIPTSSATAAAANIQSQYSRDKRLLKHILFLFIGWFHRVSTIKTQESPKKFYHIPSCRAFFADHFETKNY
jgi:hypothetical protein